MTQHGDDNQRSPENRTASADGTSPDKDRGATRLDVSVPQVAGGALASVTAAYMGSYLGAAGTFWGAGLTSVVITVGGALYQRSLEKTKDKANAAAAKAALKRAAGKPLDGGVASRVADPAQDPTRLIRPRSSSAGMHWPGGEQVVDEPVDGRRGHRSAVQRPCTGRTRADQARSELPHSERHRSGHYRSEQHRSEQHRSGSERESRTRMLRWDGTQYVPPVDSGSRAAATGSASSREASSPLDASGSSGASGPRRVRWAALAGTGALMFGLCMLVVTGFEGITGKPMSGDGGGTTLGSVFRPGPQGPEPGAGEPGAGEPDAGKPGVREPAAPETSSRPSERPEPSEQSGSTERSPSSRPSGPRAPTTSPRPTGEPAPAPPTTGARPTGVAPTGGAGTGQPTGEGAPEIEPQGADQPSSPGANQR